eukprot:m.345245 g.345245  ORF g.345245 m.345245 type:complete len:659 (+) comp16554_c1_seq2:117-2093(+)
MLSGVSSPPGHAVSSQDECLKHVKQDEQKRAERGSGTMSEWRGVSTQFLCRFSEALRGHAFTRAPESADVTRRRGSVHSQHLESFEGRASYSQEIAGKRDDSGGCSGVPDGGDPPIFPGGKNGAAIDPGRSATPLEEVTTTEACEQFVRPLCAKGCGYADTVAVEGEIGKATVFISHAWRYRILDVLEQLVSFGNAHPDTYFWIDFVILDQNSTQELPLGFWTNAFTDAIQEIGHTLLVLSPWDDPIPLTRAWCLFEMYSTMRSGVKLSIALPDAERGRLRAAVEHNPTALTDTMVQVQAERATSADPQDRDRIFKAIMSLEGGFHELNVRVKALLRTWVLDEIQGFVRTDELALAAISGFAPARAREARLEFARWCDCAGEVLAANGRHTEALGMHEKALEHYTDCHQALETKERPSTAPTLNRIGRALRNSGDYRGALQRFQEALNEHDRTVGLEHPEAAQLYHEIGVVLKREGNKEGALSHLRKSLEIKAATLEPTDPSIATTREAMGKLLKKMGQLDAAHTVLSGCLEVLLDAHGSQHPETAACHNAVGEVLSEQGEHRAALEHFNACLAVREEVYGVDHPRTINCLTNIGLSLLADGDAERAVNVQTRCLQVRVAQLGEDHPDTVKSQKYLSEAIAAVETARDAAQVAGPNNG